MHNQSDSLYWVVETNIHHPNYTIVHFYNYRNVKVHEVRMQGVYIDIRNPKQRKKLDSADETISMNGVLLLQSEERRRIQFKQIVVRWSRRSQFKYGVNKTIQVFC